MIRLDIYINQHNKKYNITFNVVPNNVYDAEKGYIDVEKLAAVSRLAGNDYAEIGRMFTIERPQ